MKKMGWLLTGLLLACQVQQPPVITEVPAKSVKPTEAWLDQGQPKLIVGIVVDQMRADYLQRFAPNFSEGGFMRLMRQGLTAANTHYNYIPTYTGPGHASIYSGATPATHGIIANDWYDRQLKHSVYCAEDTAEQVIGSTLGSAASPHRLLSTNLGDELKLATARQAKVVGVSLKDRGAVMPAGHLADAAYWYNWDDGRIVSSTWYMNQLPQWVQELNNQNLPDEYLKNTWDLFLPKDKYAASGPDNQPYERRFKGKETPTFPYVLPELRKQNNEYSLLTYTPWGNSLVTEMALAALEGEAMGQDTIPDMLAISYSSTDIIGHAFGLRSKELEDVYIRLDREIERLLNELDARVGKNNYLLFLTADHAAADVPQYFIDERIPAGYFDDAELGKAVNNYLTEKYGPGQWVEYAENYQLYLNHSLIQEKEILLAKIQQEVADFALQAPGVVDAIPASAMRWQEFSFGLRQKLQLGYYQPRSGDVLLILPPEWIHRMTYGTSHGSGYNYDTHVPLLFYGWNVPKGIRVTKPLDITDIAPTVSFMTGLPLPSGAIGKPIQELIK
jgi:predicted AlkP superfamily pyrophosphatase or phosphodiesterase